MTNALEGMLNSWQEATSNLPWGVQRNFLETLKLVEEGEITLYWGADYGPDGQPCLVNAGSHSLAALAGQGGRGKPSANFARVVSLFDTINRKLSTEANLPGREVHHFAANLLVRNFGYLKPVPEAKEILEEDKAAMLSPIDKPYIEKSDNDLMQDWIAGLQTKPPVPEEEASSNDSTDSTIDPNGERVSEHSTVDPERQTAGERVSVKRHVPPEQNS